MTTIIVDCEAQKVYADKQATVSITCPIRGEYVMNEAEVKKLEHKHGLAFGGSGGIDVIRKFIDSYPDTEKLFYEYHVNADILVIKHLHEGVRIYHYEYQLRNQPFTLRSFFRIGIPWGEVYIPVLVDTWTQRKNLVTTGSGSRAAQILWDEGNTVEQIYHKLPRYDTGTGCSHDVLDLNIGGGKCLQVE